MKNKKINQIGIMILLLAFTSCDEVIDVPLNNTAPRIVIEALITDREPAKVIISKTGDFYAPSVFPLVSGAVVTISDDNGNVVTLNEIKSGFYYADSLYGFTGRTYRLKVLAEGKEYTASTKMETPILIDSLSYEANSGEGGPLSGGAGKGKPGFIVHCYFRDKSNTRDFCMLKVNRTDSTGANYYNDDFFLYNSKYNNSLAVDYSRFGQRFEKGDLVHVELMCLEEAVYSYFSTLNDIIAKGRAGGLVSTGTPANPNSNISNGALGYFAAYSVQRDSIKIVN
ncbi:MAG: hypothetical protein QG635_1353 [Bacteroidota bacterium]|nr:hypothetical protein [Bacteroidota bacterium]